MPNSQNVANFEAVTNSLSTAKSFIIADYSGISSNDQNKLRQKISAAGGSMNVLKNRIVMLALKNRLGDAVTPELVDALNGPNAIIFGVEDAIGAAKALVDFAKENENLKLKIGGLMADGEGSTDKVLSLNELKNLATLPSKPELVAMLIGRLNSPIYGLVNVLNANLRGLVVALKAISEKKTN